MDKLSGSGHGLVDDPRLRRLGIVLVVLGVLFVVYRADTGSWNASWQAIAGKQTTNDAKTKARLDLMRGQLHDQVPPDHTIYVDLPDDWSGLRTQRIGEFAAMSRLHLVVDRADADYVVTLGRGPSAPQGVRIVAEAAR